MFDIGFLELIVISVIALIVLGPERLPKAMRTVGLWLGKAKQSFNSIKTEIDRELQVKELQQQIQEQNAKLQEQTGLDQLNQTIHQAEQDLNSGISADTDQVTKPEPQPEANSQSSDSHDKPTTNQ